MFGILNAFADGVSQPAIRHVDHDVQASPLMCHLTYLAPSQQTSLTLAPGARANMARIGPNKRAPPPDDTERGKPAKVTKVLKSEVVVMSDAASPMTSPATRAPTEQVLSPAWQFQQCRHKVNSMPCSSPPYIMEVISNMVSKQLLPWYTYGFPTLTSRVMPPLASSF